MGIITFFKIDEPIKVGKGLLEWVKETPYYITGTITKEKVFDYWMQTFKECSHALEWDYEKFIREILDYYD